jgi:phospholipid/cholesterol/gamma-HCH transport system permease protein
MDSTPPNNLFYRAAERTGRTVVAGIEEAGTCGVILGQSFYWLFIGPRIRQPVRLNHVITQMVEVGIQAIFIIAIMGATIGIMLAIQGIYALRLFGAESRVVIGIALSTVREFAPLITAIMVAARSGSGLAARIGTMKINEELDALNVMGINPIRFLVVPALLAMIVMVPALTILSMYVGLYSAGIYVQWELGLSMTAFTRDVVNILSVDDLMHGLGKSLIFAVLIAIIGVVNGASVKGGAEGVGKATTHAVVQSIAAIVITDMIFALVVTRI